MVDHVLQGTSGELLALVRYLHEGLPDILIGVLVRNREPRIVEHTPPGILEI